MVGEWRAMSSTRLEPDGDSLTTTENVMDDELSAHRTRTNMRPEQPHPQLIEAVNAIFEPAIEDRD